MKSIHESCEFGAAHRYGNDPTETGMARLSLNDDDKKARDWFRTRAEAMNCKYSFDKMGNQFAVRSGKNASAPPIMMGSHLDTQPTGGRYDGILGVTAGLEALQLLHENNVETEGSVGVVNWTNEEGARFPRTAIASAVWAGQLPLQTAWDWPEVSSGRGKPRKTMKQELERIGYLGDQEASHQTFPFAAHFELHIEQGPILEMEQRKVGVVQGVQAFKWFELNITGKDCHAGTTPMHARQDSMLCAAKLIVESNRIAKEFNGLATTGIVDLEPGSINTMASSVKMTLDIRHQSDEALAKIEKACRARFTEIAQKESEQGCQLEWVELQDFPAVKFNQDCVAAVKASAEEVCAELPKTCKDGELWKYMVSGAGHDSCCTSSVVPTCMIFTVTKDGISHNPREFCKAEDCAIGAQTLLGAVLRYDKLRAERGDFS